MARRKKPQIKGTDPSYDHSFERFRPIPNDMPPEVIVPGVEKQAPTDKPEKNKAEPTVKEQPKAPKIASSPTQTAVPAVKSVSTAAIAPKHQKRKTASTPKSVEAPEPSVPQTKERQTTLDAAVKTEQAKQIAVLEEKGLKMKDIVTLAGRRATERFTLSPHFIPKPDAERLPMKRGYHTSKRLPSNLLDIMRKEQDPLGISSDPAMVRGQFELLFWSCLDEVIKELEEKY